MHVNGCRTMRRSHLASVDATLCSAMQIASALSVDQGTIANEHSQRVFQRPHNPSVRQYLGWLYIFMHLLEAGRRLIIKGGEAAAEALLVQHKHAGVIIAADVAVVHLVHQVHHPAVNMLVVTSTYSTGRTAVAAHVAVVQLGPQVHNPAHASRDFLSWTPESHNAE